MKNIEEEQRIIEKLQAAKYAAQPSRQLLSNILGDLSVAQPPPPEREWLPSWWLRLAIPAGVALLVGTVFLGASVFQSSQPPTSPQPQPINIAAIEKEEALIEQTLEFEEFFAQEEQILQIDSALADF